MHIFRSKKVHAVNTLWILDSSFQTKAANQAIQPVHERKPQFEQNKLGNDWHIRRNRSNSIEIHFVICYFIGCDCELSFFQFQTQWQPKYIFIYYIFAGSLMDGWIDGYKCKINHIRQGGWATTTQTHFDLKKKCLENQFLCHDCFVC